MSTQPTPEPIFVTTGRFNPEQPNPVPATRPHCRALTTDGRRCKNYTVGGLHLCYSHYRNRRPALPDPERVTVPLLEDRSAIQLMATQILHGILSNRLDPKRAKVALYALHVAALTVERPPRARVAEPEPPAETVATLARDHEDFISADGDLADPELNPACSVADSPEATAELVRTFEPRNRCRPEDAPPDLVIPDPTHNFETCPCYVCTDYRAWFDDYTAKLRSTATPH